MSVTQPFDAIADTYDDTFSNSSIGRVQRRLVWMETDRTFRAGQRILEINCGTGIDALHLATRGIEVMACDSSPRMIAVARRRLAASSVRAAIDFRCLPIEQIALLEKEGPYDGIFSNFAGLNCVSDLIGAARDLARLVRPGGKAILCLFGRLCLWEISSYLVRCRFKKAFRRFHRNGVVVILSPGSRVDSTMVATSVLAILSSRELERCGRRSAAFLSREPRASTPAALQARCRNRSMAWPMSGPSGFGRPRCADV